MKSEKDQEGGREVGRGGGVCTVLELLMGGHQRKAFVRLGEQCTGKF